MCVLGADFFGEGGGGVVVLDVYGSTLSTSGTEPAGCWAYYGGGIFCWRHSLTAKWRVGVT